MVDPVCDLLRRSESSAVSDFVYGKRAFFELARCLQTVVVEMS